MAESPLGRAISGAHSAIAFSVPGFGPGLPPAIYSWEFSRSFWTGSFSLFSDRAATVSRLYRRIFLADRPARASVIERSRAGSPPDASLYAPLLREDRRCARFRIEPKSLKILARETGLEPATSGVTGRRSNQLSYSPVSERCDPVLGDLPDRIGAGPSQAPHRPSPRATRFTARSRQPRTASDAGPSQPHRPAFQLQARSHRRA